MRVDYNKRTVKQRLTTGKRKIKDFPRLPSATSFIRRTLYEFCPFATGRYIKPVILSMKDGGKKWQQ